jgi:sporulation protein YlmC with PRC-barrel domain
MANTTFLRTTGGIVDSEKIIGCKVENPKGENLGKIESVMIDLNESRILYAVLSFGGVLGLGTKLFPIPTDALSFRADEKGNLERCIVDIDKETLKSAPGYDKDNLPSMVDRRFATSVYTHYGYTPYWTE